MKTAADRRPRLPEEGSRLSSRTPHPNQFALLGQRRFAPFFCTQFLGAANDNLFKFAFTVLVTYQLTVSWLPAAQAGLVIGALFVTLFFGGYNLPWMDDSGFVFPGGHAVPLSHGWVVVLQLLTFLGKVFLLCSFQILVRWTLPRFRWDQLLRFAWKFLLPLAIANLVVTAVALWAQQA